MNYNLINPIFGIIGCSIISVILAIYQAWIPAILLLINVFIFIKWLRFEIHVIKYQKEMMQKMKNKGL